MKNLATRRSEAWTEHGRNLYCPHSPDYKPCSTEYCAHYNPDTNECIHVEAAQARVRAVDILERAARAIEYLAECTTDPCIQPRRVLGITRERGATMSLPPGVTDSMIPGNTPEDVEWEKMLNTIADSANDLYAEACEQLSESRHHRIFDDAMVDRLMREALGMAR